jgi:hypothetical protein
MTMTPQELKDQKETLELINSELAARLARQSKSGAGSDRRVCPGRLVLGLLKTTPLLCDCGATLTNHDPGTAALFRSDRPQRPL